jgi:hypothetical protein
MRGVLAAELLEGIVRGLGPPGGQRLAEGVKQGRLGPIEEQVELGSLSGSGRRRV